MQSNDREEDRVYRGSVRQIMVRKVRLFDLTCRVLAADEFGDVRRCLDPLLISTPAVGSKRSCSAPNVTPMKPPKRTTLTCPVALRSIPKCIGSIKIDISTEQNRSDQLFEI